MKGNKDDDRPRVGALILLALVCALMLPAASPAFAQQGHFTPQSPTQRNQRQGGSVLEVPTMPGRQPGTLATIPQVAPQPRGRQLTVPSRELRNQSGYQQVTVTVTDQQGRYITDLKRNDFRLFIEGQPRPIEFFRQDLDTPVSIGILVDTSGSMKPKISQAQTAIAEFVRNLNDRDDVFLFAFESRPFLLQPFTTNHSLVLSRLSLLRAYGQTSLYDTILDGLLMVQHGQYDKKALLVVTDGMDNTSQASLESVIAHARRMGVLIYSIGIGQPNSAASPGSFRLGPLTIFSDDTDEVDTRTLSLLSNESGAKTFVVREVGDGEALRRDCEMISRELRQQYTVGFITPDDGRGGYRDLRVDVPGRPDDRVRVRKGVTVGGRTESAYNDSTDRSAPPR